MTFGLQGTVFGFEQGFLVRLLSFDGGLHRKNPKMSTDVQLLPDAIQISTSGLKFWESLATNERVKSPGILRLPCLPERCMVSVICAGFKKMWRTVGFGNPLPGTARSQRITPDFGFCRAALL
jgi:hypothetical protein